MILRQKKNVQEKNLHPRDLKLIFLNQFSGDILFFSLASFCFFWFLFCLFDVFWNWKCIFWYTFDYVGGWVIYPADFRRQDYCFFFGLKNYILKDMIIVCDQKIKSNWLIKKNWLMYHQFHHLKVMKKKQKKEKD